MAAGLLAFHIAGAFPSFVKTVAIEASNKTMDLQLRGQLRIMPAAAPVFPFNLPMNYVSGRTDIPRQK
jgi:hypothetical protein